MMVTTCKPTEAPERLSEAPFTKQDIETMRDRARDLVQAAMRHGACLHEY